MQPIMKQKTILFAFFLFLFASCKKEITTADYPELILGEWVAFTPIEYGYPEGFYFISKDSCEIRPGYRAAYPRHAESYGNSAIGNPWVKTFTRINLDRYCGTTTLYKILNDTLTLLDLAEERWRKYLIGFQSPDTIELTISKEPAPAYTTYPIHKGQAVKYARANYPIDSLGLVDQIIVGNFWPMKTISITKDGELFYHGYPSNPYEGLFVSTEGKHAFKQIERLLKEANTQNKFVGSFPKPLGKHENETTITLVKNNRMATIEGPVREEEGCRIETATYSKELEWAYMQLIFLEQQMPVQPFNKPDYAYQNKLDNYFDWFHFENKDKKGFNLTDSEDFYLWTQLLHAKKVEVDFIPVYTVSGRIQSDGRYYRYQTESGETVTLDLGFNFIEENRLADRFEEIERIYQ
jgi:hypothetical protein